MSGIALDIFPLLLQQVVFASAFGLLALWAGRLLVRMVHDAQNRRPIRVPATEQLQAVRPLFEKDSICPRNTGFETRRNPRAPPVLPSLQPTDPHDRRVT